MQISSGNHPLAFRQPSFPVLLCSWLLALDSGSLQTWAQVSQTTPAPALASAAPTLPASVDLRPAFEKWHLARRVQGKRGTCSVFTLTGALEFAAANKLHRGQRFSVEFLNWAANKIITENADGGFFSDLWSGFATYGICLDQTMPYRTEFDPTLTPTADVLGEAKSQVALGLRHHWIKEWDVKTGLTDAQFLSIKGTLNQGWPVCGGFRWPKQPKWTDGCLGMCPAEAVFDGHSVLIVGYRDDVTHPGGGVFLFRNTNNGGNDGSMPYEYANAYMNDAIWIDSDTPIHPASNTLTGSGLPPVFRGPLGAIA
ncbi:MAG: C1 family peptidase, partial [Verrucomicrobia bacterium]|nr:C1 family peptidase [Verrucomicrobiota bacterium]